MIKCTYCECEVKDARSLAIHQSKKHPTEFKLNKQLEKERSTKHLEFECPICKSRYKSYTGVSSHLSDTHKIATPIERYMIYHGIKEIPKCKCGCGNNVKFFAGKGGWFGEYLRGHKAKESGFCTKEGLEKSAETRRQRFASGELIQHNKGIKLEGAALFKAQEVAKRPERRKKISKALKGKQKSPEHIAKITEDRKKYWGIEQNRLDQRERRIQHILENGLAYSSKLEEEFKTILDLLHIQYYEQFYAKEIKSLYDFKIKGKNILIEVDGDYWHCNPEIEKFKIPTKEWHHHNLKRDKIKNEWAIEHGYTLLRFWEHDIKNNRLEVIQQLVNCIK